MRTNLRTPADHIHTHEGAKAKHIGPEAQLLRSVRSCLLWEGEFYEDGQSIVDRIREEANAVSMQFLASTAISTRTEYNLRHVPLLLLCELARRNSEKRLHSTLVADTIYETIQRTDEMGELIALHAKLNGVAPSAVKPILPAQMKKGLARAFTKFDEYQFAKYNRDSAAVKPRDVMFLCHPKPFSDPAGPGGRGSKELYAKIADDTLSTPDTWEVGLSTGGDKKETFTRLLTENRLGYLALLRNLRNMAQAGVDNRLIEAAILTRSGAGRVLPFRFIAAARACPQFEPWLDHALVANIAEQPELPGTTFVLVDVSGSMFCSLSSRSDLTRADAAAALGSIVKAERLRVFAFSNDLVEVPPRHGMSGVHAILNATEHGGTDLGSAVQQLNALPHDRLIVVTDEQAHGTAWRWGTPVPDPVAKRAYMINVASNKNGVGYGRWTHIDGFSEQVLRFIHETEKLDDSRETR